MDWFNHFHFLRPLWFLALLPLVWLGYGLWAQRSHNTGLENYINPLLLPHLTLKEQTKISRLPLVSLFILWLIAVLALAGPTWKQIPQPLAISESAVVVLLDLSPSMRAEDIKPSRIVRAHLKIQDLLSQRKDGLTALIVYAGEAYVVTPLTDDINTIANLLPTLKPGILPLPGSNTEMAISLANDLVNASGLPKAAILLITDDIDENAASEIKRALPNTTSLTILGVGSESGAPIPNDGDFLKDRDGNTIIAKRNSDIMQKIALANNGDYLPMQADTSDIEFFYQKLERQFNQSSQNDEQQRHYDRWDEFAPTLLVLFTPLFALLFRRGLVISIATISIGCMSIAPNNAHASWWGSLWKNNDQRGGELYQQQDYADAAKIFKDSQWKGSAHYKNNEYETALKSFSKDDSAIGYYNRGNALAQLQRFDEAIAAYDQALKQKSDFEAAKKNKKIIEDLKKEQEQQKQKENQSQESNTSSDNQQGKQSDPQDKNNQDQNSQNQDNNQTNENSEQQSKPQNSQNSENQNNSAQQREKDSEKQEKQNNAQQNQEKTSKAENQDKGQLAKNSYENLSKEEQQALQQWLRKVPDDPSGLLRRKFEYEYRKRRQQYQQGEWQLPENNAHLRY